MNTKKQIIILTLAALLLNSIPSIAMEIRQELFKFRMAMTQDVTTDTFVISERSQSKEIPVISCRLSPVYFELGNAILFPVAAEILLLDMKRCGGMQKDSLRVIGHACQLGSKNLNQTLSLQRAKTVADFLRNRGFTVVTVQGKGSQQPITHDSQEFYKNRRVEIMTLP